MCHIKVSIISKSEDLPPMSSDNFFHSPELFRIVENSQGQSPYMAVATDPNGIVVAHMMAIARRRESLMPPYLFTQGRIYGEGDYDVSCSDKEQAFGMMLEAMTHKLRNKLCLFVEVSDLSQKMLGYKFFRQLGYFCVNWQEVHNSLHSMPPLQRLSPKAIRYISNATAAGIHVRIALSEEEIKTFHDILHKKYKANLRRLAPPKEQMLELSKSGKANVFVTTYKNKVIGGCVCVYSDKDAFLWYIATRNKRYIHLHPDYITLWKALNHAYHEGYEHFRFLDVGLPTRGNHVRKFILRFGGKPVAKYRWFRFSVPFANSILNRLFRE